MIATIGWLLFIEGVVLLIVGYAARVTLIRPGWLCFAIGLVLVVLAYLLPAFHNPTVYDDSSKQAGLQPTSAESPQMRG